MYQGDMFLKSKKYWEYEVNTMKKKPFGNFALDAIIKAISEGPFFTLIIFRFL